MAKRINYASLYTLRSDGRYQGYYRDGSGKRHPVCDRDPEQLFYKIQRKENEETRPVLFRDIALDFKEQHWDEIRDGTKSCYSAPLDRAVDRFGKMEAANITARDILNHLNVLKAQGFSKSSVKIQRTVYSLIFQHAIISPKYERSVTQNPAANVKLPSGLPDPKERQSPEDDIVKAIQRNCETAYFGMFPMFLLCTGFRRGEALAVKWEDIDFVADTVSCSRQISHRGGVAVEGPTKTKNGVRIVPLLPPLKKVLQMPEDARPADYVFPGEDSSKPMPGATYDRRWLHYCKDMGFVENFPEQKISAQGKHYTKDNFKPTLTAHMLRHGYVTILFEAGVDEYTAKELAGHANIATTRAIYTHLRNGKKNSSVDRLKDYVSNGL